MTGWEADALCAQVDPETFHPVDGGGRYQVAMAKKICGQCRVRAACLADTPDWDQSSVRGGLTARERRKLRNAA